MPRTLIRLGLAAILITLTACASLEGKLSETVETDIGFFTDQTIAIVSKGGIDLDINEAVYTRDFFDENTPESQRLITLDDKLEHFFEGLVFYAMRIVLIDESYTTDADKVAAYSDYLASFTDDDLNKLDLDRAFFDSTVAKVRSQTTMLEAMRKAQPIFNAIGRNILLTIDESEAAANIIVAQMDQKIDERYRDLIRYQHTLEKEKYSMLQSLEYLYYTSHGDLEAFDKLRQSKAIRPLSLVPDGEPTTEQLYGLLDHIMGRLDLLDKVGKEIATDWETYRATHRELDQLYNFELARQNRMREITIIWTRAHQKMASGKVVPAEWFNLEDAPGLLFRRLRDKTL